MQDGDLGGTGGERQDLLILHGANGSRAEVLPWAEGLSAHFKVHAVNLCGHGGRGIPEALTMARYSTDLIGQMDALGLRAPIVLGYSFGGVVALHMAIHHPARVSAVITLAMRWIYDAQSIGHATHLLQVSRLSKLPHRVAQLRQAHQPNDWKLLADRLSAMYSSFAQQMPVEPEELGGITCPCLLITGTTDPIASVDETEALHRRIPHSTAATFAGSAHPPEAVPMGGLAASFAKWARDPGGAIS